MALQDYLRARANEYYYRFHAPLSGSPEAIRQIPVSHFDEVLDHFVRKGSEGERAGPFTYPVLVRTVKAPIWQAALRREVDDFAELVRRATVAKTAGTTEAYRDAVFAVTRRAEALREVALEALGRPSEAEMAAAYLGQGLRTPRSLPCYLAAAGVLLFFGFHAWSRYARS
jgi:hypothetical protein